MLNAASLILVPFVDPTDARKPPAHGDTLDASSQHNFRQVCIDDSLLTVAEKASLVEAPR